MSKLSDLYTAMDKLRLVGIDINEDLERKVSKAEEDIIKAEILPVLKQKIEPALQEVKRELVLVVDYKPGQPIKVALSRKVKIGDISQTPHPSHPETLPPRASGNQLLAKSAMTHNRKPTSRQGR